MKLSICCDGHGDHVAQKLEAVGQAPQLALCEMACWELAALSDQGSERGPAETDFQRNLDMRETETEKCVNLHIL